MSRAGALALAVIVAQLVWRTVVLGHGYFSQDDFLVMAGAQHGDWASILSGDYAGGFSPGGTALAWVTVSISPLSWPLAAATVLVLQTGAAAMMWLVLTRILGDRWLRLPLLVLFVFSPLTLWTTQWWVLGLEFWTSTLLLLVAVWAVLVASRTADRRAVWLAVAAVPLALLFDDRAVLHPVILVGVALIAQEGDTLRARAGVVVRRFAVLWVGSGLVVVAYAVLRWQAAPIDLIVGNELGDVVTGYLRQGSAEVFGGPWIGSLPAHAYLVPKSWVVALNGAFLLGLAGATLQRGGSTTRASWATLVGFVACSSGLLVLAGRGELIGSLGLVHRYAAELAPVVAICLAGALSEIEFPTLAALRRTVTSTRVEIGVTGITVILLTVSAAFSTAFLAPNLYHRDDRTYVENVRAALRADRQVVLLDGGVPAGVISPWYGDRARLSAVVGYAPENPVFDLPSHVLRAVRDDGTLAPVVLEGAVASAPSQDAKCPYPVREDGTYVPMQALVPDGRWVLKVGYYTSTEGFATVDVAGTSQRFAVRSGLQVVQLVVEGSFTGIRMTLGQPDATLCLTDAAAGVLHPGPS